MRELPAELLHTPSDGAITIQAVNSLSHFESQFWRVSLFQSVLDIRCSSHYLELWSQCLVGTREGGAGMQFVGEEVLSSHHCYFYPSWSTWLCLSMGYPSVSPVQYSTRSLFYKIDSLCPWRKSFRTIIHTLTASGLSKVSVMRYLESCSMEKLPGKNNNIWGVFDFL